MNDEQLTRRAAGVMGYDLAPSDEYPELNGLCLDGGRGGPYSPLHDTDQAMDLAAKMVLDVLFGRSDVTVRRNGLHLRMVQAIFADHNGDKKAAMRRAIVECAANE